MNTSFKSSIISYLILKGQSQVSLNFKKPLPPLKQREQSDFEIQPLTMSKTPDPKNTPEPTDENNETSTDAKNTKNGNFDHMLTYIDASVVGEWLNRANRSLRKMHRWHQDNTSLYKSKQSDNLLKYESFINFANFWLGCNKISKLDHKQRRQLLEMEYSIICDEVTQAFQIGYLTKITSLKAIFTQKYVNLLCKNDFK